MIKRKIWSALSGAAVAVCTAMGGSMCASNAFAISTSGVIDSVSGGADVKVQLPDTTVSIGASTVGAVLPAGSQIEVGEKGQVSVGFEDGSQVLLAPKTTLKVLDDDENKNNKNDAQAPGVELEKGEVRVLVRPAEKSEKNIQSKPDVGQAKYRFFVRTKSAVMGVRGTDFVVTAGAKAVEIHTLSGVVEAASDSFNLKRGAGVQLGRGQAVGAVLGQGLGRPVGFSPQAFLSQFHERNPGMEMMWKGAVDPARVERIQERFRQDRQDQTKRQDGAVREGGDQQHQDRGRSREGRPEGRSDGRSPEGRSRDEKGGREEQRHPGPQGEVRSDPRRGGPQGERQLMQGQQQMRQRNGGESGQKEGGAGPGVGGRELGHQAGFPGNPQRNPQPGGAGAFGPGRNQPGQAPGGGGQPGGPGMGIRPAANTAGGPAGGGGGGPGTRAVPGPAGGAGAQKLGPGPGAGGGVKRMVEPLRR